MKDFYLEYLKKVEENNKKAEENRKGIPLVEVDFDMSGIESHHPTTYLGTDLAIELDATNVQILRKAFDKSNIHKDYINVTVYKDYIDTRVYIRRGLLTNRRICAEEVKNFVTTLDFTIRRAEPETTDTPVISILLVHKKFGRKKKKRIKKQFGGLPLRTIIEKLFMEQLWLEGENYSRFEHLKHSQWLIATVSAHNPPSVRKRLNMRQFKWK